MMRRPLKLFGASRIARVRVYLVALWKLFKHPQTPKPAKWGAAAVLAYALSPIDLIPDFVPVLGLLDDIVIVRYEQQGARIALKRDIQGIDRFQIEMVGRFVQYEKVGLLQHQAAEHDSRDFAAR